MDNGEHGVHTLRVRKHAETKKEKNQDLDSVTVLRLPMEVLLARDLTP